MQHLKQVAEHVAHLHKQVQQLEDDLREQRAALVKVQAEKGVHAGGCSETVIHKQDVLRGRKPLQ
jgi:peptidoglycan hydrolase CwlO-like protein